jgi:hypothetical protein
MRHAPLSATRTTGKPEPSKIPFDPVLRDRPHEPARRAAWLRDQYHHRGQGTRLKTQGSTASSTTDP